MKAVCFLSLLIIILPISACTPVSNKNIPSNQKDKSGNNNATTVAAPTSKNKNQKSNQLEKRKLALKDITVEEERFIDTTYYFLAMENGKTTVGTHTGIFPSAGQEPTNAEFIQMFNKSIEEAESTDNYNCAVFKYFADKFTFSDSLRQEANFQLAECNINNNNLHNALELLETLTTEKMNKAVAPKILVRIGQVYCAIGDNAQAEKYFKRLKKEYPKSIFNQIADCSRF